ncbi:class I SAM-dependent DNA methyltransferase, partial [Candidatus Bipolaricaulota bacterium]|nr:class I SAM-dependent DNA methyltransferase [Candidatus Bipolaricaulota bacterium]
WELRHCDYYADFEKPKIMYQDISEHGAFAYDPDSLFANNTAYFFNVSGPFLLGVLNGKVIEYWFRQVGAEYRGGYLRFFTQYMERLPIRRIAFTTPKEERAQLVEDGKQMYFEALEKLGLEGPE